MSVCDVKSSQFWQFKSSVCGPSICYHLDAILTSCGSCEVLWRSCWMSLSFSAWLERSFFSWISKAATRVSLSFLHFSMVCSFSASWDDKDSWQRGKWTCQFLIAYVWERKWTRLDYCSVLFSVRNQKGLFSVLWLFKLHIVRLGF